jgi:hypothetical protein
MHGSFGQLVLLRNQTDLTEQFVHGVIGNMHASEAADALRFLAEVTDRRATAIARDEVCLELTRRLGIELGVDVAAEREEAAPHSAISR